MRSFNESISCSLFILHPPHQKKKIFLFIHFSVSAKISWIRWVFFLWHCFCFIDSLILEQNRHRQRIGWSKGSPNLLFTYPPNPISTELFFIIIIFLFLFPLPWLFNYKGFSPGYGRERGLMPELKRSPAARFKLVTPVFRIQGNAYCYRISSLGVARSLQNWVECKRGIRSVEIHCRCYTAYTLEW